MQIVRTAEQLHAALKGSQPAFVPTMGALHAGHAALIRRARQLAGPTGPVVVSIFVNPTQFGPEEDFARYPRPFEADVTVATAAGATIVFAPDQSLMYPAGPHAPVPPLPAVATQPQLEEVHRPTHFAGVCQVVARLFDLVQPALAVFGEKDYQQLRVVSELVAAAGTRWLGLKIVSHPTVREPDGLAMSSRNVYLKPREREHALGLFRALRAAQQEAAQTRPVSEIEALMLGMLREHDLKPDYAVIRDPIHLLPVTDGSQPARALIAARWGQVRLIDNLGLGSGPD